MTSELGVHPPGPVADDPSPGDGDRATRLPAIAERVGGSLPEVLEWRQHALLPTTVKYAISTIVRGNPALNTESRVDLLADIAGFHGEQLDREIEELVDNHGVELLFLAIDWMYETGSRNGDGGSRRDLREVMDALGRLGDAGGQWEDPAALDAVLRSLGGISAVLKKTDEDLRETLARRSGTHHDFVGSL